MGPASPPRLFTDPGYGTTCVVRLGCDDLGISTRSKVTQARSRNITAPSPGRPFLCLGSREYHLQPLQVRMCSVDEAFADPWRGCIQGQHNLPDHLLDHQHRGISDTDSIDCSTLPSPAHACEIGDNRCVQRSGICLLDEFCQRKARRSFCCHRCVRTISLFGNDMVKWRPDSLPCKWSSSGKIEANRLDSHGCD